MIASIEALQESIAANGEFVFETQPERLTAFRILLFCIATGDFNAAHCVRAFLPYSIFTRKNKKPRLVSHGIATIARAEGPFVRLMEFANIPRETIALGISAEYKRPLYEDDRYYYRYVLTNLRLEKNLWKVDCHVLCMATSPERLTAHVVAEEHWFPAFVENPDVPEEALDLLRVKSYARNLVDALLVRPVDAIQIEEDSPLGITIGAIGAVWVLSGFVMMVLSLCGYHSPTFDAAMQMSAQAPPM
jgi:hypothetical protein